MLFTIDIENMVETPRMKRVHRVTGAFVMLLMLAISIIVIDFLRSV